MQISKCKIVNKERGFTPTPILASLRSFFSIFPKNQNISKTSNTCKNFGSQQKTMPNLVCGFSLVEIIIAVTIFVFLFTFSLKAFESLLNQQLLKKSSSDLIILLQEAKSKTLSAVDASNYGVYFESSKIILFKGSSFFPLNPDNKEIVFDKKINISDINLGGSSTVVFEKLTGDVDHSGTVTISFVSDISKSKIITIEPTGSISSN